MARPSLCRRFHALPFVGVVLAVLWLAAMTCRAQEGGAPGAGVLVKQDLPYKTGSGLSAYEQERCKLDLYLPQGGQKNFPTLVWFHGGGLTAGQKDNKETVPIAQVYARAGIAVASVNYRLSPQAKHPAYVEDAAAAAAWVKAHIAEHGGDPSRVFIGGHSAGGYLTLMVGLDPRYLAAHGLKFRDFAGLVPVAGQTLTHYTIRVERGLPKSRIIADEASPLNHARKDAPPMLILYAEKDMALRAEENLLLAAALRAAGHKHVAIHCIPGRNHGTVAHDMVKPGDPAFERVKAFVFGR